MDTTTQQIRKFCTNQKINGSKAVKKTSKCCKNQATETL